MNDMTTTRMLLSTAVLAAVAALFAGGANAMAQDDGGGSPAVAKSLPECPPPWTTRSVMGSRRREPVFRQPSVGLTGDSALKVDRAVAAANEAYNTYRDKTAIAAREAIFTDQQPSVQFRGGSAEGLRPDEVSRVVTLPTKSSASDGVDWSWVGLGAGMTALLAAGIAGVVLTTRRRGGIALP